MGANHRKTVGRALKGEDPSTSDLGSVFGALVWRSTWAWAFRVSFCANRADCRALALLWGLGFSALGLRASMIFRGFSGEPVVKQG